jgi:hypothetical protein
MVTHSKSVGGADDSGFPLGPGDAIQFQTAAPIYGLVVSPVQSGLVKVVTESGAIC